MVNPFRRERGFPSVTESMEQSAMSVRDNIQRAKQPHVEPVHQPAPVPNYPPQSHPQPPPQAPAPQMVYEDPLIAKLKKWILIGLTTAILVIATILIVSSLISRFI